MFSRYTLLQSFSFNAKKRCQAAGFLILLQLFCMLVERYGKFWFETGFLTMLTSLLAFPSLFIIFFSTDLYSLLKYKEIRYKLVFSIFFAFLALLKTSNAIILEICIDIKLKGSATLFLSYSKIA